MNFQESETVELKSAYVENIKKEILAFANTSGGKLYVGVQDTGTVTGLNNPDEIALKISNSVRDSIRPDLTMFIHYETIDVDGKKIVCVDVQRGTERPYYISKKGLRPEGVYIRQGYSSVPASASVIRRMIKETDGDHYEEMRSLQQNLTFTSARKEFSNRELTFGKIQMKTLGILNQDSIYTNLGLLLSDQCMHTIKAAVFQGTDQNTFKDRKEFSGSIFEQLNDVYDYIDMHNQTHSTYDKLYRIDARDYPEVAVREALLNLIVHREYSFRASSLVSIYDDRIEFTSIGGLLPGVTLDDIMLGISVCRNMKLANIFYRLELIEAYGTGIKKITHVYKSAGRKPQIETSDNAFKIILPNLNYIDKVEESENEYGGSEQKIINVIAAQGKITRREVEKLLNLSQTTSGRILKEMEQEHQITRSGRGRNTHYRLP